MINKQILAASICLALLITGCKKQNNLNSGSTSNSSTTVHSDIEEQDGVLRFKDKGTFEKAISKLEKGEKIDLPENFISLNNIFKKVSKAEGTLQENAGKEITQHSALYELNKDVISYSDFHGSSILDMDIFSSTIAQLVNRDGLVLINDSLFIYFKNKVDLCLDYDNKVLKNFKKSDYASMGIDPITVIKVGDASGVYGSSNTANKCSYCFNDDYHYNTTVWNYCCKASYQNILEVSVVQDRSVCNVTETSVNIRGRFLTRLVGSGSWIQLTTSRMDFAGSFNGPRSPTYYDYTNPFGYTAIEPGGTDRTFRHCFHYNGSGGTNCFSLTHATYQMITYHDPSQSTDVIW